MTKVIRKSWIAFIKPVFSLIILILLIYLAIHQHSRINEKVVTPLLEALEIGSSYSTLTFVIILSPLIFLLGKAVYTLALLRTYKMTISERGVYFEGGLLPWKKDERFWTYSQIFEALYRTENQLLGWLLRFGTIIIVGKEGSTREYSISYMHHPREASSLINERVHRLAPS